MPRKRIEAAVSLVLVGIVVFFLWEARDWQIRARLAPWTVGFTVLAISLMQLFVATRELLRGVDAANEAVGITTPAGEGELHPVAGHAAISEAGAAEATARRKAIFIIAWTVAFYLGLLLLGFRLGAPILTFAFLRFGAGESVRTSGMFALGAYLSIVLLFQSVVGLPFPPGLFFQVAGLESPDVYVIDTLLTAVRGRAGE